MGPTNHVLDGVQIPMGSTSFGGQGLPLLTIGLSAVSCAKWQNRSICHSGCGLVWAEESTSSIVFARCRQCALMGGQISTNCRIRLNHPSAEAMRLMSLVIFGHAHLDSRQTAERFEPNTVLWAFHTIQPSILSTEFARSSKTKYKIKTYTYNKKI